tara:strand:- start:87 stop:494 length:408 start_codon:yes stop_codon:yes gene_type:complete
LINFTIPGTPKALKRHRPSARGGYYDPSFKDKKDIILQIAQYRPKRPLEGNIQLKLYFYMPRPKTHYRTGKRSHVLKAKAPVYHSIKPDLDNLVKLISDCIGNRTFIVDDSQICEIYAEKIYGERPNTAVIIEEI